MEKKKIVLKDELFNKQSVRFISKRIKKVFHDFDENSFVKDILDKFPELELKQRIIWITENLKKYLVSDYQVACNLLIKSLPDELDLNKTDNDFGYFILSPYWEFVGKYGCNNEHLDFSLWVLEVFTKRFSMESAIRPFLKKYPKQTMVYIEKWSKNDNYHVRRLASEWIRPNLPWSGKIDIWIWPTLSILDNLFTDHAQYVLRSVANNLNDITKLSPKSVIEKLQNWRSQNIQSEKNMWFLIRHALRSELKNANKSALWLLWYEKSDIKFSDFKMLKKLVNIWENAQFSFKIFSKKNQKLLIKYNLYFVTASGKLSSKVFNIWNKQMKKWENINIFKKHPLKKMTTKKLYKGKHFVEIVINGEVFWKWDFELLV